MRQASAVEILRPAEGRGTHKARFAQNDMIEVAHCGVLARDLLA
jgi:hypothetical protein